MSGRMHFPNAWLACALLLAACCLSISARGEIYVVVNAESPVPSLTEEQVSAIALGRPVELPGDYRLEFVDQSVSELVFHEFHFRVTSMSQLQLNSYWARRAFTGRGRKPRRLGGDNAIMQAVSADPSLLGYLSEAPPARERRLRVVLQLLAPNPP